MKIMVIGDTHGRALEPVEAAKNLEGLTHILHLGDRVLDAELIARQLPHISVITVRGNNDIGFSGEDERVLSLCDRRIFMTHGHLYGVKSSLERLATAAASLDAGIAIFGHTHRKYEGMLGGVLLLNPSNHGYILIYEGGEYEFHNY